MKNSSHINSVFIYLKAWEDSFDSVIFLGEAWNGTQKVAISYCSL